MSSGAAIAAADFLQLPLDLSRPTMARPFSYCQGASNQVALSLLTAWEEGLETADVHCLGIVIAGPRHSGKSHLARFMMQKLDAVLIEPFALSGMLKGEFRKNRYILDHAEKETVSDMIRFINQCQQSRSAFILTGQGSPASWVAAADKEGPGKDLVTRLLALPEARLELPDEALLAASLQAFLRGRNIEIKQEVAHHAAAGLKRSYAAMVTLGEAIEGGVLAHHMPIDKAAVSRFLDDIAGIRLGA